MAHPLLLEVNTRHWLADLGRKHHREIDLFGVPDDDLDDLEALRITHLWLMGVWATGPRARNEARRIDELRRAYDDALPGWNDDDVLGSPYAVGAWHVSPLFGGDEGLAHLRARLRERNIKVILDFVPNHLGVDHAWALSRPQLFVGQAQPFAGAFAQRLSLGTRWLAHGKDPFFPGWTDTVQLDYRKPETRAAMTEVLATIAERCDGVRCDMAMLVLADVFDKTWAHVPCDDARAQAEPQQEFWPGAIAEARKRAGDDFLFLAEAYWGLEDRLVELGFDYAYDKTLYDLLVHEKAWDVQPHVLGLGARNERRAHFLENHDEPRVAKLLATPAHRAAALLVLSLPGLRFLHDGQREGRKRFARIQLSRRATESTDDAVRAMYATLFAALADSAVGTGEHALLTPTRAWADNASAQCLVVVQWQEHDRDDRFDLTVVNLAPHRAQARVRLTARGFGTGRWYLVDRLGPERWERDGEEIARDGLWLDVEPHAAQLFSFERA